MLFSRTAGKYITVYGQITRRNYFQSNSIPSNHWNYIFLGLCRCCVAIIYSNSTETQEQNLFICWKVNNYQDKCIWLVSTYIYSTPALIRTTLLQCKSVLLIELGFLYILVTFYYLSTAEIWPDKRDYFWWEQLYKRGLL